MSKKPEVEDNDSDFQSIDQQQQPSITEQIEDAIRQLPTLQQKVHTIAINYHILQKRELEDKKDSDIRILELKGRKLYDVHIEQINAIVQQKMQTAHIQEIVKEAQAEGMLNEKEVEEAKEIIAKGDGLEPVHGYWLKCMLNSDIIAEQIHQADKKVLENLYSISANRSGDSKKLEVTFWFKPNKWFHNQKLTKQFQISKQQPTRSLGEQIQWKQGMNYTVTKVAQKKKKKSERKQKQQIIKQPSFFHFFDSIDAREESTKNIQDGDELDDLIEDLELQYELSTHIYEDLIPKSLQFYLNCEGRDEEDHEKNTKGEEKEIVKQKEGEEEDKQEDRQ